MNYTIDDILDRIDKLPTLNSVAFEVINLCSEDEISLSQLVRIISNDQSLASQVLKVANSSYFNYPRKIYSLERAVVVMGLNLLRDIALSIAIFSLYKGLKVNRSFDMVGFWGHTLKTGYAARVLADQFDPFHKDVLYIGGLLHDIGKLVLLKVLQEDYILVLEKSKQEEKPLVEVEKHLLGFTHADMGGKLLDIWKLPESVVGMVQLHHLDGHSLNGEGKTPWGRIIYLANIFAHLLEFEERNMEKVNEIDPSFTKHFSFTDGEIAHMVELIEIEIKENQDLISILQA